MTFSKLCQLNGGCMGCGGHDFSSKKDVKNAIKRNTKELAISNPKTKNEFKNFRDRYDKNNLLKGVCRNLVSENGCFVCPLHPARQGEDLRENHCDVNYLCQTAKQFATWNKKEQQKFIEFIESKSMDNISYSMAMDKGSLLEGFLSSFDPRSL